MPKLLISAGDYSADMHGMALVNALRALSPSIEVSALGGIKLREVANRFLYDMVGLDVSGFSQPVKQFFNLRRILNHLICPELEKKKFDAVILIDYYGFNIHIAQKAKENGIPVFYFVSPQVWASRKGRIKKLKKFVSRMLVIFPFEEKIYQDAGVPVTFVGNPLVDMIPNPVPYQTYSKELPFELALLPGSRERELVRHIPTMVRTFLKLKTRFQNLKAKLFAVDSISNETYRAWMGNSESTSEIELVRDPHYELRSKMGLAITASGTATLENALLGLPMVVLYQTSYVTYWVAKQLIQVPFISMPNILLGKKIVPELVQMEASPESLTASISEYLSHPLLLERMNRELIQLRSSLGPPGAYNRAAKIICESVLNLP